jgi:hypothetical protein
MINDKDSELMPSIGDVVTVRAGDYAVGHCRPPRSKQFKPGVSGNPRGRPKRDRNFNRMFHFALEEKLPANGTGKQQTAYFAFVQSLVDQTLQRKPNALRLLMRILKKKNVFKPIATPGVFRGGIVTAPPEYRQDRRTGAHVGKLYYGTANDGTKVPFYGTED